MSRFELLIDNDSIFGFLVAGNLQPKKFRKLILALDALWGFLDLYSLSRHL